MTSTPAVVAPDRAPISAGADPATAGVEPFVVWFLATCHRCERPDEFAEPFRAELARDDWAAKHITATGHTVTLSAIVPDRATRYATILRRTDDGDGYRVLCTAKTCERWSEPRETPQLALAMGREHVCPGVR